MTSPSRKRSPRSSRASKPKGREREVQAACLAYLTLDPRCAWAQRFNSGATKLGVGKSARYIKFAFRGCADILGQLATGHFLAVEVKGDRGRVTKEQQAFINTVNHYGGLGVIAFGVDDLAEQMDRFHAGQLGGQTNAHDAIEEKGSKS